MEKKILLKRYYTSFLRRKEGRSVFKHFFFILPAQLILSLIALLVLFLLKILRPVVYIRVGKLVYTRFGHLAANTELYLRRRAINPLPSREWHIFVSGKPANEQLFSMINRKIPVIRNQAALWMFERLQLFTGDHDLFFDMPDPQRFFEVGDIAAQLTFTEEEEVRGRKLLEQLGIKPGVAFVCFHVRDNAYLDKTHVYRSRKEWAYHDHRDCDIRNYLPAVKYLASLGIYVIRMGYIVKEKLTCDDPRVIDYASDYRTDSGDVYLCAKAKFFLSSDGGLSSLPWIFNVPVAYANGVPPLGAAGWRREDVFINKKLWSIEKKRFLTFQEILDGRIDRWFHSQKYEEAKLEVIENSQEEILDLVKEMNARLDGRWITSREDEELQSQYWKFFKPGDRNYGNPSRIGAKFLRQNQQMFEVVNQ